MECPKPYLQNFQTKSTRSHGFAAAAWHVLYRNPNKARGETSRENPGSIKGLGHKRRCSQSMWCQSWCFLGCMLRKRKARRAAGERGPQARQLALPCTNFGARLRRTDNSEAKPVVPPKPGYKEACFNFNLLRPFLDKSERLFVCPCCNAEAAPQIVPPRVKAGAPPAPAADA